MLINNLAEVSSLTTNASIIAETEWGTRRISYGNFSINTSNNNVFRGKNLVKLYDSQKESLNYLETATTKQTIANILAAHPYSNSTYKDIYIGDYIKIDNFPITNGMTLSDPPQGSESSAKIISDNNDANNVTASIIFRVAGFDIMPFPNSISSRRHICFVPDSVLCFNKWMHIERKLSGGIANSYMVTNILPNIDIKLNNIFGDKLLSVTNYFSNVVGDKYTSNTNNLSNIQFSTTNEEYVTGNIGGENYNKLGRVTGSTAVQNIKCMLMNEIDVNGCRAIGSSYFDLGYEKSQLPLFRIEPKYIYPSHLTVDGSNSAQIQGYWLRDIETITSCATITGNGLLRPNDIRTLSNLENDGVTSSIGANNIGIRPKFFVLASIV